MDMEILITEDQLRRIIEKQLIENDLGDANAGGKVETKIIPFNFEFQQGYHSEKYEPNLLGNIINTIKPIVEFLHNNPNATVKIIVESGESAVTNYDAEKIKGGTPKEQAKLKTGELSNLRASTIKKLLPIAFQSYSSKGWKIGEKRLNSINQQIEVKTYPPTIKYKIGTDDPKDPKYKKDQFIRFNIVTENITLIPCLVDFTISIDYDQISKTREQHRCDQAFFTVSANGVFIGNANMNNSNDGDYRFNRLKVTQDLATQILSNAPIDPQTKEKIINLEMTCAASPNMKYTESTKRCHESVPHITIYDNNNKIVSNYFPYKTDKYKQLTHGSTINIGVLDKCGKMIRGGETVK